MKQNGKGNLPVIIDGVRTPFMRSHNALKTLSSVDLGRFALSGLMERCSIGQDEIEHVSMGTVIHDSHTPNVARESVLAAGISAHTPADTVSLACISSNMAATHVCDMIQLGHIKTAVAAGVDTCSDPPIRISPSFRKSLVRWQGIKKPAHMVKELKRLKNFELSDLAFDVPSVKEFSNGKSMGQGCEILAQNVGIQREDADRFAARSHELAVKAWEKGVFDEMVLDIKVPPGFKSVHKEDGPRADAKIERLTKLRAAFDKQFGINTAGNSSFLTDGGSAMFLCSMDYANETGRTPKAVVSDYIFSAGDALTEMLSGPSLTIPKLLERNKLSVDDIEVWEIHEAFASQVLANLKLMKDDTFAKERLGLKKAVGEIPWERINIWGGSLSLGHPFGATGVRLLTMAAQRLQEQKVRYAVVSGCAAGGHGSAILLENPNFL